MSTSIYNIPTWANSTSYKQHDIVKYGDYYYYALEEHVSHASQTLSEVLATANLWGGTAIDPYNGVTRANFIWEPSYPSQSNISPRVKTIKFGDGYEQRVRDGVNTILLDIDFSFNGRTIQEATAILHFLYEKESVKSFLFTPPAPHNKVKRFVCRSWNHEINFYNNHTVSAKFEEISA